MPHRLAAVSPHTNIWTGKRRLAVALNQTQPSI